MTDRLIRVLLAEDSPTIRHLLLRLINDAPSLQVIAEARNGQEAVELTEKLKPDVISMDIQMPGMDGLEATRQIMARCPTPIVMVSGVLEADIDLSFKAIQAGALAVIPKPPARDEPTFRAQQRRLTSVLTAMAGVSLVRRWGSRVETPAYVSNVPANAGEGLKPSPAKGLTNPVELLAIGASAGGPSALSTLLSSLPASLPIPILVVQHLPDEFIAGLARWLDDVTPLKVCVASAGMPLQAGSVYLSPGRAHLQIARHGSELVAQLFHEQNGHRYRPSINVLFRSVAAVSGAKGAGVILTGMGDDGADGLLALRQAGGRTFAQDRESCTVFGMPAAAIERGAVQEVLPLRQFPAALLRLV
jgi:two-component system, chemotaxis family, protein-glutamate methylesterase/glutaminase